MRVHRRGLERPQLERHGLLSPVPATSRRCRRPRPRPLPLPCVRSPKRQYRCQRPTPGGCGYIGGASSGQNSRDTDISVRYLRRAAVVVVLVLFRCHCLVFELRRGKHRFHRPRPRPRACASCPPHSRPWPTATGGTREQRGAGSRPASVEQVPWRR